jgi:ATP/maltotriose-dependent transcriptional regulator MalT
MGDEELVARAMDGLKLVALVLGDYPALRALASEVEDILTRHDEPWYLMWTLAESSYAWAASGDWAEARRRLDEAQRLGEQAGDRAGVPYILTTRAWFERVRGHYDQAVPLARTAVDAAREGHNTLMTTWSEANLGAILAELGELDEAIERLEESRRTAERGGIRIQLARIRAYLASARQRSGAPAADDLAAAEELLGQVRPPPGKCFLYGLDAYLAVADLRLTGGRPGEATDLVAPLLTAAEDAAWAEGIARTALFLGKCARHRGDSDAAAAFLRRAVEDATNAGLTPVLWEAHGALARLRRDQADTAAADEHQRRARAVVETLAAAITDPGLRRCFLSRTETVLDPTPAG